MVSIITRYCLRRVGSELKAQGNTQLDPHSPSEVIRLGEYVTLGCTTDYKWVVGFGFVT